VDCRAYLCCIAAEVVGSKENRKAAGLHDLNKLVCIPQKACAAAARRHYIARQPDKYVVFPTPNTAASGLLLYADRKQNN
ncbi:hypothetical protein, partial [Bradyrhizobium sp.]|uniref:hypothetical protein n=1 Tax=Bradyrhizobium sp. TaxID=376 RepID=UPI002906FBBF